MTRFYNELRTLFFSDEYSKNNVPYICSLYKESVSANARKKDNSCVLSGGVCKKSCRAPLLEEDCPGQRVCCGRRGVLAKGGNSNRGKDLASRRETERNNKRKLRQQKGEDKASKKGTGRNTKKMKKEDRKTRKQQQKKDKKKNQRRNKENSRENRGPERQNKEHKGKNGVEKEKTKEGIKKNKAKPTKAKGQEKEPQAINIQRSGMKVTSKDTDGEKRLCKKTPKKCRNQGGKCVKAGTCTTQTLKSRCRGSSCECCLTAGIWMEFVMTLAG